MLLVVIQNINILISNQKKQICRLQICKNKINSFVASKKKKTNIFLTKKKVKEWKTVFQANENLDHYCRSSKFDFKTIQEKKNKKWHFILRNNP